MPTQNGALSLTFRLRCDYLLNFCDTQDAAIDLSSGSVKRQPRRRDPASSPVEQDCKAQADIAIASEG
jgi:hypothetical protein